MEEIRVLVVDDSIVIRSVISELLSSRPQFNVVGTAVDPYDAREKIKRLKPHVITLDIEMPKMDGVTFLRNLMKLNPLPVVMLSTLTHAGADVTLKALELGAVDFIAKPHAGSDDHALQRFSDELCDKVKVAASNFQRFKFRARHLPSVYDKNSALTLNSEKKLVAIGASTGGVEALKSLLMALPVNFPPVLVTQHIPESFSQRFADRLNKAIELNVVEASDHLMLVPGTVYIAPGSHHLKIVAMQKGLCCVLDDGEKVNRHRPSVEVMFDSLGTLQNWQVVPILLTGMGIDGASAMKRLACSGAYTIVQDEESSIVWGMPGEAVKQGAAKVVLPLSDIAKHLIRHMQDNSGL